MALSSAIASQSAAFVSRCVPPEAPGSSPQSRPSSLVVRAPLSENAAPSGQVSRRQVALGLGALGASLASLAGLGAEKSWALLDADEDDDLLERVKKERNDRKKKLESFKEEEDTLQSAVSELRAVGKALDIGDLSTASKSAADVAAAAAAGGAVEQVIKKLASGSTGAVGSLRSGLADLQAALTAEDILSAKKAFVASATALKELSSATGLAPAISGL